MNYSDRITKRLIEIREDRDSKRAQGLKDGTLTIVLDHNGIPIVVPIDQPILTLADRFHKLAEKEI